MTATGASAEEGHFDFVPSVSLGGQIVTGGYNDESAESVSSLIVNGYDFGENAFDPYTIGDPGFNTRGASSFQGGSTLHLSGLPVDGRFLSYWDGDGAVSFGDTPAGVTLDVAFSPTLKATFSTGALVYAPGTASSVPIGTFSGTGSLHTHVESSIFFDGLQAENTVPVGAYLLSFELLNPGGTATTSDPLFIVYNNGLDEEVHGAAIAAVPEPATIGLLGLLAPLALRRRRAASAL